MTTKIVRCSNCGEVVEADTGACSACGAVLRVLPAAPPPPPAASFAERYRGTEFDAPAPISFVPQETGRQSYATLLVGLGIALLVVVVVASALLLSGTAPVNTTTLPPVVTKTGSPTPQPTAAQIALYAYRYVTDRTLAVKLAVHTEYALHERVNGTSQRATIDLTATINGAKSKGHYAGSAVFDFVCLGDSVYVKPANGKWAGPAATTCTLKLLPLLALTDAAELKLVGPESVGGQEAYHLTSTPQWRPDPQRLSLLPEPLPLNTDAPSLDLWVTAVGEPIKAEFSSDYVAPDGTHLMQLHSTYTFTDVGKQEDISAPL